MHPNSFIKSSILLGAVGVLAACALLAAQAQQEHPVTYAQADIAYGAQVYTEQCASCHGPNGEVVPGVDLRSGKFRNANTDQELSRLMTNGINTMAAMKLDQGELAGLVAFLRNMNSFDSSSMKPGDPARGQVLVNGGQVLVNGKDACLTCHRIKNNGSFSIAPDLSDIGSRRSAGYLQRTLAAPDSQMLPINRPVRAVTRDGKTINGRRLNEDDYAVLLTNDQGRLVALVKADLREYTILTKSPMPSFQGKLTPEQMADVLSYLLSLKGQ